MQHDATVAGTDIMFVPGTAAFLVTRASVHIYAGGMVI